MENSKNSYWWLVALFLLSFVVRLSYIYQIEPHPISEMLIIDSLDDDRWGQEIAGGDWLGKNRGVFYRDPLYAYSLGVIYSIFGHKLWLVRVIQAFIDSCTCILLYLLARRIFNPSTGIITSLLAAFYGPFVFTQGLIEKTTLMVFLLTLFLLIALDAIERPGNWNWFFAGLVLGFTVLTRGQVLAFAPTLALGYMFYSGRDTGLIRRTSFILIFTAGLLSALLPVAFRNLIYGNEFALTVPSIGLNFYVGNNPSALGVITPIQSVRTTPETEAEDAARVASMEAGRTLSPSEVSSFWLKKGLAFVVNEPLKFAQLLGRKFIIFWNEFEVPDVYNYYFFQEMSSILRLLITFGVIAPAAIAGIAISFNKIRAGRFLIVFTAIYAASLILFHVTSRYRLAVVPLLLPFSGYAIFSLIEAMKEHRYKRILLISAIIFPAALATNMKLFDDYRFLSQSHSSLGNIYFGIGKLDAAMNEYQTAIKLDPANWDAANNLACVFAEKDINLDEALRLVTRALSRNPTSPEMLDTLALVYFKMGRLNEARDSASKAVAMSPQSRELAERLKTITQEMEKRGK